MYKYHSIEQFRNCIKDVLFAYREKEPPILNFKGSVKLHGTNAGVELPTNTPQSRNQILTEQNTNMGFFNFHHERKETFTKLYTMLDITLPCIIYGEFAGSGIQQGVAISQLEKSFYYFGIKVITGSEDWQHYWIDISSLPDFPEARIYNLHKFKQFDCKVDFSNPQTVQNLLGELTLEVERECPVAKKFGISGVGEGIVWEHITQEGKLFSFKVKGEKHSSSKVKTLAAVDIEKLSSIESCVQTVCSEARLYQGWFELFTQSQKEASMSDLGSFIKWISTDVNKEEADTLEANSLTMKDIGSVLSKKAKVFFIKQLNGDNHD